MSGEAPSPPVDAGLLDRRPMSAGHDGQLVDLAAPDAEHWIRLIERHGHIRDAIASATVIVRPRGLRAVERHVAIDGQPLSAALFDIGLCACHGAAAEAGGGGALQCDLSQVEQPAEARLWDDVLAFAERALGLSRGTIKLTGSLRA